MDFEGRTNQKNHHKIPLDPPFPKGETMITSLLHRRSGGIFKTLKCYQSPKYLSIEIEENLKF